MNEILTTLVAFVGALNIFNLRLFQKSKRPERKSLEEIARENGVFNWVIDLILSTDLSSRTTQIVRVIKEWIR